MQGETVSATAEYAPLSPEDIAALHQGVQQDRLQWLPDSSAIVFKSAFSGAPDFWSISRDGTGLRRLTIGSRGARPRVSPDGRWLAYLSGKSGSMEVWLHPLSPDLGSEERRATRLRGDINSFSWSPDGQCLAVACNQYGRFDIFESNIATGAVTRLTHDPKRNEHYPVYTPDGKSIVFVRLSDSWAVHDVIQMDRTGNNVHEIASESDFFDYRGGRQFGHPLVSPDGKHLLFRSRESDWVNYQQISLPANGGGWKALAPETAEQVAESGSMNAGEAVWSPDSRFVAYLSNQDGNIQLRVVSREGGRPVIVAGAEEGVATNPAWSPDGRSIAFLYESYTQTTDVWIVDVEVSSGKVVASAPRQLTQSLPSGLARKFDRPRKVQYPTFDGRMISAYVYQPRGHSGQPGPAIVEVHGGPPDQFRDTLHPVVQYYVQRGYTVLLPNPRGSAGYGKEFEHAIQTGWGHDDLKDLIAGAEFLVREGLAAKDRIAITGQSYGGHMTMAAACLAPAGVFQCSISRTGYSDWTYYYHHADSDTTRLMEYQFGPYETNEELYHHSSTINFVKHTATPVFVIDQDGDPTSHAIDQRLELVRQLKKYGKPARYKKYRDTGGMFASSETATREMLPDMMAYFKEHIG